MRAASSLLGPLNPPEGEAIATGTAPWQRYRDRRASGHRGRRYAALCQDGRQRIQFTTGALGKVALLKLRKEGE